MGSVRGFDTRLHTERNIAFVYRPVLLECPNKTYIIGWGDNEMLQNIQNWVKNPQELHMFLYPAMQVSTQCMLLYLNGKTCAN